MDPNLGKIINIGIVSMSSTVWPQPISEVDNDGKLDGKCSVRGIIKPFFDDIMGMTLSKNIK